MQTLYDFATPERLVGLLIRERAKCCHKNAKKPLPKDRYANGCVNDDESIRLQLSKMMPHRHDWVKPRQNNRSRMADGKVDKKAVNIKALKLTIKRDRKLRNNPTQNTFQPAFNNNGQVSGQTTGSFNTSVFQNTQQMQPTVNEPDKNGVPNYVRKRK